MNHSRSILKPSSVPFLSNWARYTLLKSECCLACDEVKHSLWFDEIVGSRTGLVMVACSHAQLESREVDEFRFRSSRHPRETMTLLASPSRLVEAIIR